MVLALFVCGCTSNRYEDGAWEVAETSATNGEELSRFLEHYKDSGDREKYEAACFLVCNMPGKYSVTDGKPTYDVDVVKADSLVRSLEASFALRESSPYLKDYSFGQFLEYILPYRVANEPLEYGWKEDCPNRFVPEKGMGIKEAADAVNAQIKLDLSPASYSDLPQSYSSLMKNGFGKCDDRTALLVMALRAAGIPSAYEFVPQWGSSNNGHSFVSVILPDGSVYPLQNTDKATGDGYLSRKPTKIYRKMYELQGGGPSGNDSSVPELFRYGDLLDVTSLHRVGSRDVEINAKGNGRKGGLYLAAFLPGGWNPVAESHTGLFKDVSTGTRLDMPKESEAEGLGDGVVYLPVRWNSGRAEAVGNPVIVSDSAVREIIPDTAVRETVRLLRKYPLNARIVSFAKLMVMGRFEGANRADFSDAMRKPFTAFWTRRNAGCSVLFRARTRRSVMSATSARKARSALRNLPCTVRTAVRYRSVRWFAKPFRKTVWQTMCSIPTRSPITRRAEALSCGRVPTWAGRRLSARSALLPATTTTRSTPATRMSCSGGTGDGRAWACAPPLPTRWSMSMCRNMRCSGCAT